jgi:hypothetical protein
MPHADAFPSRCARYPDSVVQSGAVIGLVVGGELLPRRQHVGGDVDTFCVLGARLFAHQVQTHLRVDVALFGAQGPGQGGCALVGLDEYQVLVELQHRL